jgi:hypothetical protein
MKIFLTTRKPNLRNPLTVARIAGLAARPL